jgi:hypothetical protein
MFEIPLMSFSVCLKNVSSICNYRGDYETHYIQWVPLYVDRLVEFTLTL